MKPPQRCTCQECRDLDHLPERLQGIPDSWQIRLPLAKGAVRYRFVVLPLRTRHGPWRDNRREAVEDAVAAGLASRDEHEPERIYLDELVEIEHERRP